MDKAPIPQYTAVWLWNRKAIKIRRTPIRMSSKPGVVVPENVTLTVNGVDYTGCTLTADSI